MAYLKYFTIANESPQGKPRVFLACHPDDFDKYSRTVLRDILSTVNCAVYYMDPAGTYEPEELRVDLSQMQLFVFAVTNRMLTEPNIGMDELFPYAEKEHIPVLPLLQEEVDLESFGKRFGDLQFLGRVAITSTSISYEEQLKKYLSSVLVDDELAEKVRAAFDAYIFLSYRKKDRAHAQELMRLIHKNDFCRDVAIWYDEFLVPGENFNDGIRKMMLKSDLFALAVTPNLVNEENYVMSTEYPGAVEQNKKIVALEMVPTARNELEEKYKGIPACTDPRDSESLAKALSDALGRMSLREDKDSDPDHLYYIGLAYLGGIDVEVDHEKAVELITRSADELNVEATKKLVSMYRNGEGVPRSYKNAIKLQQRFVELLEMVFEGNEGVRSSTMYATELFELSDLYDISNDPEKQKETLRKLISVCDRYDQKWSPLFRMTAVQSLGELEAEQGNYKEAKKCFTESLDHFLAEIGKGASAYAPFAATGCIFLAGLCRKYGEDHEAQKYCLDAIDIAEKYAGSGDFKAAYLSAYNMLGAIAAADGDISGAQSYYDKVEEIYRSLQQAGKDVSSGIADLESNRAALKSEQTYKDDLSEIYLDYGANISSDYEQDKKDFLKMQERIKEKRDAKRQNVDYSDEVDRRMEALESIKEKAGSSEIEDRRKVADAYMQAGMAQQTAGRYDKAEESYLAAYEFYVDYVKERPDPEAKVILVGLLSGLSETLWNRDKKDEAIQYYERLVDICEEMVESRGNVRDYEVLAAGCSDLASRLKAVGSIEDARERYLDAIDAASRMVEIDPGRHQRELLAGLYYDLAYLEVDPNNFIFGGKKPDMQALAYSYEIYTQLGQDYPGDNKIMNEMNRISASFMMNGVMLSDIDEMIENKKPLRRADPKKAEKKQENPVRTDNDTGAKKEGGFFGKLFGRK